MRPHLQEEYLKMVKGQCKVGPTLSLEYFPSSCCEKHDLFDIRIPGVFKTEFVGNAMVRVVAKLI